MPACLAAQRPGPAPVKCRINHGERGELHSFSEEIQPPWADSRTPIAVKSLALRKCLDG